MFFYQAFDKGGGGEDDKEKEKAPRVIKLRCGCTVREPPKRTAGWWNGRYAVLILRRVHGWVGSSYDEIEGRDAPLSIFWCQRP